MKITRTKLNSQLPEKKNFDISLVPKILILLISLGIGIIFFSILAKNIKPFFSNIAKWSINVISKVAWDEPQKDEYGQVNFLILWYWGWAHQWGFLTDSMMVASFNPKDWKVWFLSIPRDLYVDIWTQRTKINWVFPLSYLKYKSKNSNFDEIAFDKAAKDIQAKVKQISWISTQYYAFVSFDWFRKFIDSIWGIDITLDKAFVDNQYPERDDDSGWYITFSLPAWTNHLNWEAALKFARSRHSTSDFSRSARQQQIIKAVLEKVKSEWFSNPTKIKELYLGFQDMVHTNLWLKQIVWMAKYADWINGFFNFWYSSDCNSTMRRIMQPGCFLYSPPIETYGSAVLLPSESIYKKWIENYDNMKKFAFFVLENNAYIQENTPITILDSINYKTYTWKKNPWANLAFELKNYLFNVVDLKAWVQKTDFTTIYKNNISSPETEKMLKYFFDFSEQKSNENLEEINNYPDSIVIQIWNDFELKNN